MKLKSISARNFKGLTFEENLAPITVLIGSNFAGKTARTDAIRLLLLGFLPELGKEARSTFGLSSGSEMEVSGEFDNGLKIRRRFYLKGDTVKKDEEIPAEIAECGQLAVMLNAETYFALGPTARVNYVFENCLLGDEFTIPAVSRKIAEVLQAGGLVEHKAESMLARICRAMDLRGTVQAFVELTLVNTADLIKDAKSHADRMEKTIQGLIGLRMADEKTGPDLPGLEVKISKLRADVEELNLKKNALAVRYELMVNGRERRRSIESTLSKLGPVKEKLDGMIAEREKIRTALGAAPDSADAIDKLKEINMTATNVYDRAAVDWKAINRELDAARISLSGLGDKTSCPYCGAVGDGWKALKTAELNGAIATFEKSLEDISYKAKTAKASIDSSNRDLEAARVIRRATEELEHKERAFDREIPMIEAALGREADLREELAKLPPEDPQLDTDVDMIQTELNVKNEEILDADGKRKAVMGRAGELQRLGQAETDRDAAKADVTIGGDVLKKLREIQGSMVEGAFKPLLELANSFFGDVFKSPLAYNDGEIGTWRDGVWVTHRTMSGTEKALTYAAIQAALAAKSPVKIMLIDELGRLDNANLDLMMDGVALAVSSGKIDGFIGIDTGRIELYRNRNKWTKESAFLVREIQ